MGQSKRFVCVWPVSVKLICTPSKPPRPMSMLILKISFLRLLYTTQKKLINKHAIRYDSHLLVYLYSEYG